MPDDITITTLLNGIKISPISQPKVIGTRLDDGLQAPWQERVLTA